MISVKFAESLLAVVATFHFLPTRGLRRNLASHDPSASEFGQIMMCNEHWRARVFLRLLCSLAIEEQTSEEMDGTLQFGNLHSGNI